MRLRAGLKCDDKEDESKSNPHHSSCKKKKEIKTHRERENIGGTSINSDFPRLNVKTGKGSKISARLHVDKEGNAR